MAWNERRVRAVRRALEAYGLRVVCLACGHHSRWWPDRAGFGRLRAARCERCGAANAVRSEFWVARFPDRASQARRAIRERARVLES